MCNNPCLLCVDSEDCDLYVPDLSNLNMTYKQAMYLLNNDLIKRDDQSYNDYIKKYFKEKK